MAVEKKAFKLCTHFHRSFPQTTTRLVSSISPYIAGHLSQGWAMDFVPKSVVGFYCNLFVTPVIIIYRASVSAFWLVGVVVAFFEKLTFVAHPGTLECSLELTTLSTLPGSSPSRSPRATAR